MVAARWWSPASHATLMRQNPALRRNEPGLNKLNLLGTVQLFSGNAAVRLSAQGCGRCCRVAESFFDDLQIGSASNQPMRRVRGAGHEFAH
jgi:hypothetical protein